ncbi:GntR family transcriptional regulator [Pedobacter panaciterrae]|uniref:GntR family transcriptional regulator n=1 Tax=Pedobacter panaciterrae TaxID=363849 RepID=A0ABU8NRM1_9SPHI|nr:GntR family transcriptional regulator [Pedobacter panaciterrae]NQX55667.1 GntR family transcriptional regulator [Pedobacter panaciterrae]
MKNYLKIIEINEYSKTPKYLQIFDSILNAIKTSEIDVNDVLPSINYLSESLEVGRNTIERAYLGLKKFGVVDSVPGKGYFVSNAEFEQPFKILLLFNKLSDHKKIIYDAFTAKLGHDVSIDFYVYNNNFSQFRKILENKPDRYNKVVIIPHFFNEHDKAYALINSLPKEKLVLVDKLIPEISGDFCTVYEDFENDISYALEELKVRLSNYHTIKIIFPSKSYYSTKILTGFTDFCLKYAFNYEVLSDLKSETFVPGTAYINLREDHLVELVEKIVNNELKIGSEIGVISYNETPIKKLILSGITTISTNFAMMGEAAANMVLDNLKGHLAIPFKVTARNSL